tara:strand:- start:1330 stop:2409 length:1080 start_codon:yes stop_codon:yes gene_type:complete
MNKKIIFAAGGTGGHIFPAINLMKHFFDKGYKVLLVTDQRGSNFINSFSKFNSHIIKTETLTNKNILKKIYSIFIILYSLLKSIFIINKEKPDLIIGFGGHVSFPISFVSKFFNLPLLIYEPNLVLGRANKYLLKFAKKIFLAKTIKENFPKKFNPKICEVGTILDKNVLNYSNFSKSNNENVFSILILGGSQGAEIFGKVIPEVVKMISKEGYNIEVKHQCIKSQKYSLIEYYKKNNIKNYVFEFDKNVIKLILSSDLAITRCGASTTAELAHTLTPFIAVPLPGSIDNHQYLNAKFYKDRGCCWIIEQKNLNKENLFNLIMETIKNKNKLETVRNNMKKIYSNKVYDNIENQVKQFI